MANIADYLSWRGDLTFRERPFNDVDNLVLSTLAYLDLLGVVPTADEGGYVTVAQAAAAVAQDRTRSPDGAGRLTVASDSLLILAGHTARFADVRLSRFVDLLDDDLGTQFSAVTCALPDGTQFVAFRGTDNTIMGWREDFTMSFELMPAQRLAAQYLIDALRAGTAGAEPGPAVTATADPGTADTGTSDTPLEPVPALAVTSTPDESSGEGSLALVPTRVGGHSKGGNLAVYAAMMAPPALQDALVAIYSNDGLGLSPDVRNAAGLARIADRIIKTVPEFAVVGMLFEPGTPRIVASNARGLLQHDPLSWQVEGTELVRCATLTPRAGALNRTIDSWLAGATLADRQTFTEVLFDALSAGGARLTTDIGSVNHGSFESVLISLASNRTRTRRTRHLAWRAALRTVREANTTALWHDGGLRDAVMIGIGVLFVTASSLAVQVIGAIAVFALAVWGAARILQGVTRARHQRNVSWPLLLFAAVVLAGLLILASHLKWLIVPTNLLLGLVLLVNMWNYARLAIRLLYTPHRRRRMRAALAVFSAVISFLLAATALSTVDRVLPLFIQQVGAYLLIVGIVELFLLARDRTIRRFLDIYTTERLRSLN